VKVPTGGNFTDETPSKKARERFFLVNAPGF
jgi:hypothetical protein